LFACPIKIEEINNSMFVDMIGEFELECRGAGK